MNNIGTNLVGMGSLRGREDNDYFSILYCPLCGRSLE
ncbi:gp57 [Listeria phage A118]|nr:gp57 [Listeria phage A118]YP_001468890.1 gp50 [Listeria phage A006]AAY53287.1 gp50 [Listeria phage A006]CAB53847.1 gp57 [Listeria phage A118]